jgi:hypothetical protein
VGWREPEAGGPGGRYYLLGESAGHVWCGVNIVAAAELAWHVEIVWVCSYAKPCYYCGVQ